MKKGIAAADLRPYSVDDPFGLAPRREPPRRGRFRPQPQTQPLGSPYGSPQKGSTPALRSLLEQRLQEIAAEGKVHASSRGSVQSKPPSKEKKSGCLTPLLIAGLLYTLVHVFGPYAMRSVQQEILRNDGQAAPAQIISVDSRNITINDKKVFEIELLVFPPDGEPYTTSVEQSMSRGIASALSENAWAEVNYDPAKMSEVVITKVGISKPAGLAMPSINETPTAQEKSAQGESPATSPPTLKLDAGTQPKSKQSTEADAKASSRITPTPNSLPGSTEEALPAPDRAKEKASAETPVTEAPSKQKPASSPKADKESQAPQAGAPTPKAPDAKAPAETKLKPAAEPKPAARKKDSKKKKESESITAAPN